MLTTGGGRGPGEAVWQRAAKHRPDRSAATSTRCPSGPTARLREPRPLTAMQKRIWALAAAGKFFEGLVVFMTGVALPLIHREFTLDPVQSGIVGAATLFGILVGASTLGDMADRFGRRTVFIAEMVPVLPVPGPADDEPRLRLARRLPVRHRGRAGRRLSHRPPDDLREHPEPEPRPAGAGCLRLPGPGRARRHGNRLPDPRQTCRRSAPGAGCTRRRSCPPRWSCWAASR